MRGLGCEEELYGGGEEVGVYGVGCEGREEGEDEGGGGSW